MKRPGAAELLSAHLAKQGAPVAVVFQVTDRCNYGCVHCYETHGEKEELSFAEIDRILGEVADEGTLFLTLTGGEFFMRRDAEEILRAARRRRFAVKLLTTGWFVTDARADLIAELGAIQVDMSFYAGDPNIHDHVTQIKGSWQRTIDAARRLRARNVGVVLKSPVMGMNLASLEDASAIAKEIGCGFQSDPKVTSQENGDQGPIALRATDAALREFYASERMGIWQDVERSLGNACHAGARDLDETPCRAGQDLAGINPQGLVSACHSIMRYGGDLRRQSFREIWRKSPEIIRIREMTWGKIDECNVCDVRPYCMRCHAMADLEDGKLDGPSREACRHAVILRDLLRDKGLAPASATSLPPQMQRSADGALIRVRPPSLRILG